MTTALLPPMVASSSEETLGLLIKRKSFHLQSGRLTSDTVRAVVLSIARHDKDNMCSPGAATCESYKPLSECRQSCPNADFAHCARRNQCQRTPTGAECERRHTRARARHDRHGRKCSGKLDSLQHCAATIKLLCM